MSKKEPSRFGVFPPGTPLPPDVSPKEYDEAWEKAYPTPKSKMSVHFSSVKMDMETPPNVFEPLDRHFHFGWDVCATAENAKCENFFDPEADGLAQDWPIGRACWCNPPYGRELRKWIDKAAKQAQYGARTVCLVPARTDTAWWLVAWLHAAEIAFVQGRIRFVGGPSSAPFPSAIIVFEPHSYGPPPKVRLWRPGTEWA